MPAIVWPSSKAKDATAKDSSLKAKIGPFIAKLSTMTASTSLHLERIRGAADFLWDLPPVLLCKNHMLLLHQKFNIVNILSPVHKTFFVFRTILSAFKLTVVKVISGFDDFHVTSCHFFQRKSV